MKVKHFKLKKELGLFLATLYGVGIILGAGIYFLIGEGAGLAGNSLWLAFVIGAIVASFTGLSYAELAGMYPRDAAEYVYTKKAFRKESLAFVAQWIMAFTVIVSGSAVALGFGNYFSSMFGVDPVLSGIGLILTLSLLNYRGIRESSKFNTVATFIEMSGLLFIIAIGLSFLGNVNYFETPNNIGLSAILPAATLVFFAFIGFEELANMSEEAKNPKVIPKAIVLSIIISTFLYVLVSVSAVSILNWQDLAQSETPLASVASKVIPQSAFWISVIALFSTSNTVLITLIVASRLIYGLACNNSLPRVCASVGKRGTPYVAISLVAFLALVAISIAGVSTIALLTTLGIFLVYVFVNAAVIALRYREPRTKRPFRIPLSIGKFPVLPLIGLISSLFMLFNFDYILIIFEIVLILIGFGFYKIFNRG